MKKHHRTRLEINRFVFRAVCAGFTSFAFAAEPSTGSVCHSADGPQVRNVGAVAPDILGVEIQEGEYKPGSMFPYTAQPGDTFTGGAKDWIVRNGELFEETVAKRTVMRKNGQGKSVVLGVISSDEKFIFLDAGMAGAPLEKTAVDQPDAYAIQSSNDPAFAAPVMPLAVFRKSKPNSPAATGRYAILHKIYLKLPSALKEGAAYTVCFKGINTRKETVAYQHDTRVARSDAVHVTQVGYRPDDPFKRGYLSVWLGTGGGCPYTNIETFELVDAQSGKTVFTGKPELGQTNIAIHELQMSDYTQTPVYWLDFSAFRAPGAYRVRVPGIGASYPFPIADTSWDAAFKTGMRGILSQRSGIELGPPFLDYKHPRDRHPDDGIKFYQTDSLSPGTKDKSPGDALIRVWKATGKLEEAPGLWGGHHGAGDWITAADTSLSTAAEVIEAFEINGDYARRVKLSLPKVEAENNIPDILDEALWDLAAYKRLQLPNGAVRHGYDSAKGPGGGQGSRVSWDETPQPVCVFAPTTSACWYYAWTAAQMARLLAPYDAAQARDYGESAVRAWKWVEAQSPDADAPTDANRKDSKWLREHALEAAAAVALYQYTHEPAYHERFKQICEIQEDRGTNYTGGWIEPMQQSDATFFYARLPDDLTDPALKKHALNRYILAGNVAVHFMRHNVFNLATANPGVPMLEFCQFFTNPGMGLHTVRAHALTHDPRYLETIIASTGFGLGANPENLVFTTGLGANPIRFPLIRDYIGSGQPAPAGITVFGPSNQHKAGGMSDWVHAWVLGGGRMAPGSRTWPPPESYVDIFAWAGACEFNLPSPLASAPYVWCYLAARP